MKYLVVPLATILLTSSGFAYRSKIYENPKSTVVPQQNAQQSSLSVDIQTVTNFMALNGAYVRAYQKAEEHFKYVGNVLMTSTDINERANAAVLGKESRTDMKRCEANMVKIHRNPKDWTIEDLQKMKTDPKGAEAFKALVRVRDAMYGNEHSAEIKNYLTRKLQTAMPGEEEMAVAELKVLLDRVQKVGGGKLANTP